MRTLIIGAGETGYHIAQELSSEKMEVTLIDENPTHLLAAQKELNVACVRGNGTSLSVLEQAGIEKSDLLIAATDQDETNLICCLLANHYGVETKIAITKTGSFFKPTLISKYLESGISQIINSSMVAAQEILDTAGFASAAEVSAFGEKNVLLIGYKVKPDSPLEGKELIGLRSEALDQFLIGSIVREGESFIPSGKDRILAGDYVYILVPREKQEMLNQFLKVQVNRSRRAVVAGSGQTALRVAEGLIKSHYEVTLIIGEQEHPDIKRKILNNKNFHMIRGDAESVRLQLQLDVPVAALFIAATKDDFVNIAASVVARYLGAQKTIALVNKEELAEAARSAEIDGVISPRLSTARRVRQVIYSAEGDLNFTTISETNMEVHEMVAGEDAPILGLPLKKFRLPQNSLVGAIVKGGNQAIIPNGETAIEAGNQVIMLTLPEGVPRLRELIEGKK